MSQPQGKNEFSLENIFSSDNYNLDDLATNFQFGIDQDLGLGSSELFSDIPLSDENNSEFEELFKDADNLLAIDEKNSFDLDSILNSEPVQIPIQEELTIISTAITPINETTINSHPQDSSQSSEQEYSDDISEEIMLRLAREKFRKEHLKTSQNSKTLESVLKRFNDKMDNIPEIKSSSQIDKKTNILKEYNVNKIMDNVSMTKTQEITTPRELIKSSSPTNEPTSSKSSRRQGWKKSAMGSDSSLLDLLDKIKLSALSSPLNSKHDFKESKEPIELNTSLNPPNDIDEHSTSNLLENLGLKKAAKLFKPQKTFADPILVSEQPIEQEPEIVSVSESSSENPLDEGDENDSKMSISEIIKRQKEHSMRIYTRQSSVLNEGRLTKDNTRSSSIAETGIKAYQASTRNLSDDSSQMFSRSTKDQPFSTSRTFSVSSDFLDSPKAATRSFDVRKFLNISGITEPTTTNEVEKKVDPELRKDVVQELLETEENYVEGISKLDKIYRKGLFTLGLIDSKEAGLIFGQIDVIITTNTQILELLREKWATWDTEKTTIGDIFLRFENVFKVYVSYVNGYQMSLATIHKLSVGNPQFNESLAALRSIEKNLDMQSYLIMPIQRIPRYILLLEQLLKYTPSSYSDYSLLTKAVESMRSVAEYINKRKKAVSTFGQVLEIESRFPVLQGLAAEWRVFISEVKCVLKAQGRSAPQEAKLYIFGDCVVVSWLYSGEELMYRKLMFSSSLQIKPVIENGGTFALKFVHDKLESSFKLLFSSKEDMQETLRSIRDSVHTFADSLRERAFEKIKLEDINGEEHAALTLAIHIGRELSSEVGFKGRHNIRHFHPETSTYSDATLYKFQQNAVISDFLGSSKVVCLNLSIVRTIEEEKVLIIEEAAGAVTKLSQVSSELSEELRICTLKFLEGFRQVEDQFDVEGVEPDALFFGTKLGFGSAKSMVSVLLFENQNCLFCGSKEKVHFGVLRIGGLICKSCSERLESDEFTFSTTMDLVDTRNSQEISSAFSAIFGRIGNKGVWNRWIITEHPDFFKKKVMKRANEAWDAIRNTAAEVAKSLSSGEEEARVLPWNDLSLLLTHSFEIPYTIYREVNEKIVEKQVQTEDYIKNLPEEVQRLYHRAGLRGWFKFDFSKLGIPRKEEYGLFVQVKTLTTNIIALIQENPLRVDISDYIFNPSAADIGLMMFQKKSKKTLVLFLDFADSEILLTWIKALF